MCYRHFVQNFCGPGERATSALNKVQDGLDALHRAKDAATLATTIEIDKFKNQIEVEKNSRIEAETKAKSILEEKKSQVSVAVDAKEKAEEEVEKVTKELTELRAFKNAVVWKYTVSRS